MSVAARVAGWQKLYGGTGTPSSSAGTPAYFPPSLTVVFNGSTHAPGYTITLQNMNQLVAPGMFIQYWNLVRVSPNVAVWPNQIVRGGDFVTQGPMGSATYVIEDTEAPFLDNGIGVWTYKIEVYTSSSSHTGVYDVMNTVAMLESFVTTSPGQVYVKSVEDPTTSRYGFFSDFKAWTRPGRILSEFNVLGRRNKVVLSDVGGGKEGKLQLTVMSEDTPASTIYNWETLLLSSDTFLLQTTNYVTSGIKDTYFKIKGLEFDRGTTFQPDWNSNWFTEFMISIDFVEVDRPTTTVPVSLNTWQQVLDNNATWQEVLNQHATWLDVLLNPST